MNALPPVEEETVCKKKNDVHIFWILNLDHRPRSFFIFLFESEKSKGQPWPHPRAMDAACYPYNVQPVVKIGINILYNRISFHMK